jgi:hypothetical protein
MTMTSDGANLLDPGNQGTQTANINQNQFLSYPDRRGVASRQLAYSHR